MNELIDVPADEHVPPGHVRTGFNFLAALGRYVAAGCPNVTAEQYRIRIAKCAEYSLCRGGKCLLCNCNVENKAQMATERCPHHTSRWSTSIARIDPTGVD